MKAYKHLFGPVPSRRLGLSLGIDLTPGKICSLDCVYCQVGRTRVHTLQPGEFVPTREVCEELDHWLDIGGRADHITLAGSGEPTLHVGFGNILDHVKDRTTIPSVLLSNGSLFFHPDIRRAATKAAIVKLTVSAWDEESFRRIQRPPPGLTFEQVMNGQRAFREDYSGTLWLEVFLVEGMNTDPAQIEQIARLAASIAPDTIHLNTAVRPPAEKTVMAVTPEKLAQWARLFHPKAEVMADFIGRAEKTTLSEASVFALLRRHSATLEQIAAALGSDLTATRALLEDMIRGKMIRGEQHGGQVYYDDVAPPFAEADEHHDT